MSEYNATEKIQILEKAVRTSDEIRQRAEASKGVHEQALKRTNEQIEAYGISADEGEKEIARIQAEREERIRNLLPKIPFDLLKRYGKITDDELKVLGLS